MAEISTTPEWAKQRAFFTETTALHVIAKMNKRVITDKELRSVLKSSRDENNPATFGNWLFEFLSSTSSDGSSQQSSGVMTPMDYQGIASDVLTWLLKYFEDNGQPIDT